MTSALKRLGRIARARFYHELERLAGRDADPLLDDDPQRPQNPGRHHDESASPPPGDGFASASAARAEASSVPPQVREDLAVFELMPPSSLAEVRRARNREIKKYHSDRFANDPEKYQTSKEIMQIYNAAFERLEAYFKAR